MGFQFHALNEREARAMLTWRYEPPYDIYNIVSEDEEADVRFFTDPANRYFAMLDDEGTLVGFCCFGMDARVPGGDYSQEACDIGMGVRPDLTGQGRGGEFARGAFELAIQTQQPGRCRVTIAGFNQRARRVWEQLGFQLVEPFHKPGNGMEFVIMTADPNRLKT